MILGGKTVTSGHLIQRLERHLAVSSPIGSWDQTVNMGDFGYSGGRAGSRLGLPDTEIL